MKLKSVTFRDGVKLPGEHSYDTTSYIDLQGDKPALKGVPVKRLEFNDGLVVIETDRGETIVPWTNVIDMRPFGRPIDRAGDVDSKPGKKARGGS